MNNYTSIDKNRFNLNAMQPFTPNQSLPDPMGQIWGDLVIHTAELVISMVDTSQQPSSNYIYTFNLLASGSYPFNNDNFRTVCTEIGLVYWNALMSNGSNGHNQQLLHEITKKLLGLYSIGIINTDRGLQDRTPSNQRQTVENAVDEYRNHINQAITNINGGNQGGWGQPQQQSGGWGNDSWGNDNNSWGQSQQQNSSWGSNQNQNTGWGSESTINNNAGGGWAEASSTNIPDHGWGSGFSDGTDSDPDRYKTLTEGFVKEQPSSNDITAGLSPQELQDAIDLGLIPDPSVTSEDKQGEPVKEGGADKVASFANQVETDHWGDMLGDTEGVELDSTNWDAITDGLETSWDNVDTDDIEDVTPDLLEDGETKPTGISLQDLISEHDVITYPKSIDLPENFLVEEHNLYYEMIDKALPTADLITINSDTGPIIAIREEDMPYTMYVHKPSNVISAHVGRNITPDKVACILIDSNFLGYEIMLDLSTHDIYNVKPVELETLSTLCSGVNGVIGDREPDDLKLNNVLELGLVSNPSDFMADIEAYLDHRVEKDGVDSILDKTHAFRGQFLEAVVRTKMDDIDLNVGSIQCLAKEVSLLDDTNPRIGRAIENVVIRRFNRLISSMYPTKDFAVTSVGDLAILDDMLGTDTEDVEDLTNSERIVISKMIKAICGEALRVSLEQVKNTSDIVYNTVTVSREFVVIYGGNLKDFKFISEQKGGVQTYRVAMDALPAKLKDFLATEASSLVSFYLSEDRIMTMVPVSNEWLQFTITETI